MEGVIIKPGQAYLWVAAEGAKSQSLDVAIARYTRGVDAILAHRSIPAGAAADTCGALTEVVTREPIAPREDALVSAPEVVNDQYFCAAEGRVIIASVRYYTTDRHAVVYQATVRRVAQSIRVRASHARTSH